MTRHREPRNLSEYVIWFLEEWANEMPVAIHRDEVFYGPPDRDRDRVRLGAEHSAAADLVGGSLLGTLAYNETTRRLIEEDDPHAEEPASYEGSLSIDKHLVTPLRSAMRRCGRFMEGYLVEMARCGGDWLSPAQQRGCWNKDIAQVYANEAFRRLWREYQTDRPAKVDRTNHRRNYSDDVPWTELSESAQNAIIDAENNAA